MSIDTSPYSSIVVKAGKLDRAGADESWLGKLGKGCGREAESESAATTMSSF
jgi:hypothetical protein